MSNASATVTIYRGLPAQFSEFRDGDWVALDWTYCKSHADAMTDWTGEPWHVISMDVPASAVEWAGSDLDEWYSDEGEKREFFFRAAMA